jgi:hypothetical protein
MQGIRGGARRVAVRRGADGIGIKEKEVSRQDIPLAKVRYETASKTMRENFK